MMLGSAQANRGCQKKGGKAKPLSAKVSIRPLSGGGRIKSSARSTMGIDFAPFPSKLTKTSRRRNARGSVALDPLHGHVGGGASRAAIQYLGEAAAGDGRQRRTQASGAEPFRGRVDQRESSAAHRRAAAR